MSHVAGSSCSASLHCSAIWLCRPSAKSRYLKSASCSTQRSQLSPTRQRKTRRLTELAANEHAPNLLRPCADAVQLRIAHDPPHWVIAGKKNNEVSGDQGQLARKRVTDLM